MSITETVVKRPITVVIIFAIFIGLAAFLVPNIPVALFPDMEMPVIMINTMYPGASPEDVEANITDVLEKQLSNVSDLESITSTSSEGSSRISMEFSYSKDLDDATNDIRDKLETLADSLPDDAESPTIFKMNSDNMPVMTLAILGDLSQNELKAIGEDTVQPLLERVKGVANITVRGGQDEIVKVDVSQNRLEAYNLTLTQVANSLDKQNYQLGAGNIQVGSTDYLIRTSAEFESVEEIENVVVATFTDSYDSPVKEVRLKDVADVSITNEDEESRVYINGRYGVTISIQKESDANSISVSDEVTGTLEEINKALPDGVDVNVLTDDSSTIRSIMNQTYKSLFQGIILAMLVLFFFLRTWSSTIIIALSIPISIFITILFMYFMGLSINLLTLTGIILGLGMVVDCSIVIIENIYRFRERGTKLKSSAILGSREMIMSITASTLTTVCVFIPILLFRDQLGMMGQIFGAMSYTIVIALVVSLLVALTLVPSLSANYLKIYTRIQKPLQNKYLQKTDQFFARGFENLDQGYKKILTLLMNHKGKVLILVALVFVLSVLQFSKMGIIMAPPMSEDSIRLSLKLPSGTSLDETEQTALQMAKIFDDKYSGSYVNMTVTIGSGGGFSSTSESNAANIRISLPTYQEQIVSAIDMKAFLREHFNDFPSTVVEFESFGMGVSSDTPVDVVIRSDDMDAAMNTSNEIKALIEDNLPLITDPSTDLDNGLPQIEVHIDRDRAYNLGLNMYNVAFEIGASINGLTSTQYRMGGEELSVIVALRDKDKSSVPDLNKIFVVNSSGTRIAVSNVASLDKSISPVSINREEQERLVHVTAGLADGYTLTEAQSALEELLDNKLVLPDGVSYSMGGGFSDISDQIQNMIMIVIIAILLVFGVMAAQFESLKDPFIILMTIPLMLIGVVLLYRVTGNTFSIMSAVGLVVLVGLVVNTGIVLVDYTNMLLKRGWDLKEACVEAAGNRLRPILMTTFTTILGMFPLAFLGGAGTEQVQPIAQTIIGGLLASSIMTLFVTPLLFAVMNKRRFS
ncbi:efflux RND transporter permease subunit [Oceanispirochaeta sp.]|jgi:HAE1 family hydrophobic/amphiphilic exporter-1|uniref:efflux RND transporter permease subunit n=1 Tax=Oceanispirochaeta sp. TaxID=2035350 RepID=UPI002624CA3A|nr:efflux RND transporter permease subunit [Oceanispirochaeta sp.]MDA3957673.1 efflux RND transporter permease subunit [Oceanispirochaeta sp.]